MPAEGGTPRQVTLPHGRATRSKAGSPTASRCWSAPAATTTGATRGRFFRVGLERRGRRGAAVRRPRRGRRALARRQAAPVHPRGGSPGGARAITARRRRRSGCSTARRRRSRKLLDPDTAGPAGRSGGPTARASTTSASTTGRSTSASATSSRASDRPLTEFNDDSVVFPCISRDGSTIVFRHLFDLYRFQPGKGELARADRDHPRRRRPPATRSSAACSTQARQVAFSKDGLEIAFIAGGDLWVMDTVLMEPQAGDRRRPRRSATRSSRPRETRSSSSATRTARATSGGPSGATPALDWWQNTQFKLERLTQDAEVEADLQWSPDGARVAFVKGRGDLWVMDPKGKDARRLIASWDAPRVRLVARRRLDRLRPGGRRLQPGHLDHPRRRLAAAVQPLAPPRQRVVARLVARRQGRSPSPAAGSRTRSTSTTSGSATRTTRRPAATGRSRRPSRRSSKARKKAGAARRGSPTANQDRGEDRPKPADEDEAKPDGAGEAEDAARRS